MFKNRTADGRNNVCGTQVAKLRQKLIPRISQRALADQMTNLGCVIDKNGIQRIEDGSRFVTDIELKFLARALGVTITELLDVPEEENAEEENAEEPNAEE